jgi:hypothetical protein
MYGESMDKGIITPRHASKRQRKAKAMQIVQTGLRKEQKKISPINIKPFGFEPEAEVREQE